jgi:hypothetical protein
VNVRLPDGTVLQNVPDGTTKAQIAAKLKGAHGTGAATPEPAKASPAVDTTEEPLTPEAAEAQALGGGAETLAALGTGGVASLGGGLNYLGTLATTGGDTQAAKAVQEDTEKSLTYQPRGAAGQNMLGGVGKVADMLVDKPTEWLGEKSRELAQRLGLSPEASGVIGSFAKTAPQALSYLIPGREAASGISNTVKTAERAGSRALKSREATLASGTPSTPLVGKAREMGYVLKPSEAGGSTTAKTAEGLAGSPKLSGEMSVKNQKVTNRVGAEVIGAPKGAKLSPKVIADSKKPHNKVYREMGDLGERAASPEYSAEIASIGRTPGNSFPTAKNPRIEELKTAYDEPRFHSRDAILHIRQLRKDSKKNIKSQDPVNNSLGHAQMQVANAIENELERFAVAQGKPDLVKRFKAARTELAKIHTVETATLRNGDLSAPKLAAMQERGVPLTGPLKDVADIATEFGEVTREATKVKNKTPVTALEGIFGAAGPAIAALGGHPAIGVPAIAGMAARPITRRVLSSNRYQNKLAGAPRKPGVVHKTVRELLKERQP